MGAGGVKLGDRRVYTLAYADDVAVVAENEEGIKTMIRRLEKYLDRKDLTLNAKKTKIMSCRRGGGRNKKIEWCWKGEIIEEVKEFKYLGYVMMRNGGQEAHVRDRVRKAGVIMKQVWGISKRTFGKDWMRRMWLFERLVWTVIDYAAEIWGWKERGKVEALQERYIRWTLGVDRRTPGYMVREELERWKLKSRGEKRAWNFERRLEEGKGSELARKCWEEVKERCGGEAGLSEWEKDRQLRMSEWGRLGEGKGERRELKYEEIEEEDRKRQKEERWEKILCSRYNKWYKVIKGVGIPGYLVKGWGESRWGRIARFRLGGEVRESRYWEEEERKKCRICEVEEETWEHVWEGCVREVEKESWQERVRDLLSEEGGGEEWMRSVESMRWEKERQTEREWKTESERAGESELGGVSE